MDEVQIEQGYRLRVRRRTLESAQNVYLAYGRGNEDEVGTEMIAGHFVFNRIYMTL